MDLPAGVLGGPTEGPAAAFLGELEAERPGGPPAVPGVDLGEDAVSDLPDQGLVQNPPGGQGLRGGAAHGGGSGHAEGHPQFLHRPPVRRELHQHGAAQGGDLHGLPLAVLEVAAGEALVILGGNAHRGEDFLVAADGFAGAGVPLPDGHPAGALGPLELQFGLIGHEGGGAVGAGDAVADVAAKGAHIADLRAAHLIDRLAEHIHPALEQGGGGDFGEGAARADDQSSVLLHSDLPQLGQAVEAYQAAAGVAALPGLDEHVGAPGDGHGLRVPSQRGCGVGGTPGLVILCNIVHGRTLLSRPEGRPDQRRRPASGG